MSHALSRARKVTAVGTASAAIAALCLTQAAAATPGSASPTVSLSGSRAGFAANATDLGAVSGARQVDFQVLLALPNAAAVEAAVRGLSTPGSASYRQFLTPAQFRAAYSPSASAVAAVETWVRSHGLKVASVAPSRLYVEVTGTMANAEKLVGTQLHNYSYRGHELAAPVADYRIPTGLRSTVAGIVNLDDSGILQHPATDTGQAVSAVAPAATPSASLPGPPPGNYFGVQPCSQYYGQKMATDKPKAYGRHWPYTICGYNADQYEKAFGLYGLIQHGTDGKGVTVAITDAYASPTILQDAQTWSKQNNLPQFRPGQFRQRTPAPNNYNLEKECGPQGWYGEETLDVESVHAMAPGANVLYAGGRNCAGGLNMAWASVIDRHLASVVTNSWSFGSEQAPQGQINFFHEYLLEAATTGITVMFSSGDSGPYNAQGIGTTLPASDPYATGVGGTSTEIGKQGQIVFQTGWSNFYSVLENGKWTPKPPGNFSSGGGGGVSTLYREPFYQYGVVPPKLAKTNGKVAMRVVPDVSMPGDPNTGLRIGETQQFPNGTYYATYRLGGTSLSSPLFAGVVADAIQYNGSAIGFINPLLYRNMDKSALSDVLPTSGRQATVRTNLSNVQDKSSPRIFVLQTIGVPTAIRTTAGYDDVTGVGTPNGRYFLEAMKYRP